MLIFLHTYEVALIDFLARFKRIRRNRSSD